MKLPRFRVPPIVVASTILGVSIVSAAVFAAGYSTRPDCMHFYRASLTGSPTEAVFDLPRGYTAQINAYTDVVARDVVKEKEHRAWLTGPSVFGCR